MFNNFYNNKLNVFAKQNQWHSVISCSVYKTMDTLLSIQSFGSRIVLLLRDGSSSNEIVLRIIKTVCFIVPPLSHSDNVQW